MNATRILIYVRVSKKREDMQTLRNQMREAEEFANARGWVIAYRFIEKGKSAYKKSVRRPEFEKAMAMVARGDIDVFLVWKVDRFYRSGLECLNAVATLNAHGCEFKSVSEPNIPDTREASGMSYLSGLAFGAEISSDDRGKAIDSWHRGNLLTDEIRANGKTGAAIPAGWRPFGYDRPTKSVLEINESEAAFLRMAAAAILDGTSSFKRLVTEHRPLSIQCTDDFGNLRPDTEPVYMSGPGLRRTLINPTTYGMRRGDEGELIPGCWAPILPIEMFAPMVTLVTDPSRLTHDSSGNEIRHALTGIAECGKCGDKLRYRRWVKSNSYRYHCRCNNSVDGPSFEQAIDAELWNRVTPSVWQGWRTSGKGYDVSVREGIEKRIAFVNKRFREGKYDSCMWEYEEMREALDAELIGAMNNDALDIPDVDDIRASWDSLLPVEQRKVYRQAFHSITLNRANGNYALDERLILV